MFPVLERIFEATGEFAFRRHGDFLEMGSAPSLRLRIDWRLERREADNRMRLLAGVCRVSAADQPIPAPVLQFAVKNKHTVMLVHEGDGDVAAYDPIPDAPSIPTLDAGGQRLLVRSLLGALGIEYEENPTIGLFEERADGFALALRTQFLARTAATRLVIHIGELPAQFKSRLREKGMGLVEISTGDPGRAVIERTLQGLGLPFAEETDQFRPHDDGTPPRWIVVMNALKVQARAGVVYLVPPDADAGLCGFIEKHWSRRCVRTGA